MILPTVSPQENDELPLIAPVKQRKFSRFIDGLILVGLTSILIFGPLFYGAVEIWQVNILIFLSVLTFAAWALKNTIIGNSRVITKHATRTAMIVYGLPALFGILVVIQLIPLPESILAFFSPARAALNEASGIKNSTPVSIVPHTTQLWLIRIIALVMIFFVVAKNFRNRKGIFYILALVLIIGYMNAIYGILLYLSDYTLPSIIARKPGLNRAVGTYVNANHFAGYLEMCAPLALSVLFIKRSSKSYLSTSFSRRVVGFLSEKLQDKRVLLPLTAFIVMTLGIILSMSRMGIFSFAVCIGVFGLLLGKRHGKKLRFAILSSIVGLVLLFSLWLGLDPVLERYSLLGGGVVSRVKGWELTRDVIDDYPILGTGLGTFTHVSPNYQTISMGQGHWEESHNDYLNLISDTGIAGLVIALGFLAAWYFYVLKLLSKRNLRTYQRSIAAGCVAGVSVIVIHSIADFNLQIPANAFYFATLLGLAIAVLRFEDLPHGSQVKNSKTQKTQKDHVDSQHKLLLTGKRMVPLVVVILVAIFALPIAIKSSLAETWLQQYRNINNTEGKIQALEKSIRLDCSNPELHYRLAMVHYWEKEDYNAAKQHLIDALRLAPCEGKCHFRLGMVYARLGNDTFSEKELSLAKKLAPTHPDIHFKIGYYHFFKGRRTGNSKIISKALAELRKAIEINGNYLRESLRLVEKYLPQYEYLRHLIPDTANHHRSFGDFLANRERWTEALKEYRATWRMKLTEDNSYRGDENLCLVLARSYLMTGNIQDAKRGYRKALTLADSNHRIFEIVRTDFTHAKLLKEGIAFFYDLKSEFTGNDILDTEIAKSHLALGDYDEAERLFLELSEIRPSKYIYRHLFDIAMHRRDYNLAEVYATKAINLAPSEATHYAMLARAKAANRNYEDAVQAFKHALAIEPDNKTYKQGLMNTSEQMLLEEK